MKHGFEGVLRSAAATTIADVNIKHRIDITRVPGRSLRKVAKFSAASMLFALLAAVAGPAIAGETRNVLVLYASTRMLPANIPTERGLRTALESSTRWNVELYSEFLDIARFNNASYVDTVARFLHDKYALRPPDVIVIADNSSLAFLLRHREKIFPQTPIVCLGVGDDFLRSLRAVPSDVVGALVEYDSVRTIERAFRLHPAATRLVLVTGVGEWDRRWEARLRSEVPRFPAHVQTEFFAGLPTETLRARLAELGDESVVFTPGYYDDGTGRVFSPREAAGIAAGAAGAPVYGPYESFLGTGVVGGYMPSFESSGLKAGEFVLALLDGAVPAALGRTALVPATFNIDWRQARRWRIDENEIPGDAIAHFREPTLWEAHRAKIVIAGVVIALQTLLIVGLGFERRRRQNAERESRARLSEMAHMNRHDAMEGLAASIAHELNQPLGAIHNNAGAAKMLIKASPPRLSEVAEVLDDIQKDDMRASDVIARVRSLLRKSEVDLADLDLNEAVTETMRLLAHDAERKRVSLTTELTPGLPKVRADRIQVQQVTLNLALNAIESVSNQPDAKRRVVVRTRASDKEVEVSVVDSGAGIQDEILSRIFKPFVTSKSTGMGLGLSISRTIVEAHGGKIRAENLPGGGAAFHFSLPFASAPRR